MVLLKIYALTLAKFEHKTKSENVPVVVIAPIAKAIKEGRNMKVKLDINFPIIALGNANMIKIPKTLKI